MPSRASTRRDFTQIGPALWSMPPRVTAPRPTAVPAEPDPATDTRNPHAFAMSKLGASKGGKARAAKMTPAQRSAVAKKAAAKRWG